MGKAVTKNTYYTRQEYLSMEKDADYKSEFFNGEIFSMAGKSRNHSIICVNMLWAVREAVNNKNCTAFDSNMKLDIPKENSFVYPDDMVVCGDIEFSENRTDIIKNPMLIIEVLSHSTQAFDRGDKFKFYRSLPDFQEYVLISQDEPLVETYFKQNPKTWIYTVIKGLDEKILLRSLEYEIDMKEIYHKADLNQDSQDNPDHTGSG